MKKTQSKKYSDYRAFSAKQDNLRTKLPVDSGWPVYISKEFGYPPRGCTRPAHWWAATINTKKRATEIRSKRDKNDINRILSYVFREEIIQQLQGKGDWRYWHKSFDYYQTASE